MTYRTFDIDAGSNNGSAIPEFDAPTSVRHTRSRRHRAVLGTRIGGSRIAGFGI